MNKLEAYVKKKIDAAFADYDDPEAVLDNVTVGFAIGFWDDLTDTNDIIERFPDFKEGIAKAFEDRAKFSTEDYLERATGKLFLIRLTKALRVMIATPEEIKADKDLTKSVVWLVELAVDWTASKYVNQEKNK